MAEQTKQAVTMNVAQTSTNVSEYAMGQDRILILSETAIASAADLALAATKKIAGQRGLKEDEKIDTIDVSNKDSGGRKIYAPGRIETKLAVDGLEVYGDANLALLRTKMAAKAPVYAVVMDTKESTARCAQVLITSFSADHKDGSESTYSADLVLCEDWAEIV